MAFLPYVGNIPQFLTAILPGDCFLLLLGPLENEIIFQVYA